jgi:SAM-dependent methyltransferase
MLEHLEDDTAFIKECHRVLKPAGRLIVNVPHLKKCSILRPIRNILGLTDAEHGHLRPGYTQQQLFGLMIDGFDVEEATTYSRFFVEMLDTFIRLAAKASGNGSDTGEKGMIIDQERFAKMQKLFRIYSFLYPIFWMASKLDYLIFLTRGHYLIARARRRLWIPRRIPIIKDGRSIADAALNTRIGSANPF